MATLVVCDREGCSNEAIIVLRVFPGPEAPGDMWGGMEAELCFKHCRATLNPLLTQWRNEEEASD